MLQDELVPYFLEETECRRVPEIVVIHLGVNDLPQVGCTELFNRLAGDSPDSTRVNIAMALKG